MFNLAKHYLQLSKILSKLLYDRRLNPSELAREVDLPTPTVHRLVTGKSTRPYRSSLEPIANFFSVSIDQLIGEEPLPNAPDVQGKTLKQKKIIEVPLLEWKDLPYVYNPDVERETIAAMADLSKDCFAVFMHDSSMEPQFSKGSILILDPNKQPNDRGYVLVKLSNTGIFVFRQIIIDAEHRFLKPLNPDLMATHMRLLDEEDEITGVLVEARQVYQHA